MLPCNLPVLRAWAEFAATQWRGGGLGGRMGLDYTAVMAALQAHFPKTWKRLFRGMRLIERALLVVDGERRTGTDGNSH